jgi:hypothetical protein
VKPAEMTPSPGSRYARFVGLAVAVALALCALGFLPTRRLAGEPGVPAMIGGCAIGLVSAALSGLLLVVVAGDTPETRMRRSFLAMVVRLAAAVALGAAAVAGGVVATTPLLFWIGVAYVAMLPLEVRLSIYG